MNRTKQLFIGLLLLSGICMSCSMEENMEPVRPGLPSGEAFPDSVYFILENPTPQTRVTYADAIHSDFEKEDTVGCFALDADLNVISESTKNARYRVSVHTNVETGEDRRFLAPISDEDDLPRNDSYKYLFYYPYDKNVKELSDLQKYSHMILANQNQREKYEASDLLWDICAPDPTLHCVFVKMDHAMSNVIVEVEPSLIKEGTVPTLLSRPKGVRQLNLVRGSLEEMENNLDAESYLLVDDTQDIIMWEFGRANSGNYMFRAIVPSNHVITPGTTILSIVNPEGVTKRYKTSMNMSSISFKPGRNYYLNVVEKHDYVAPEIGDDETWVYDVLDPETGQPVGLLCREYLHYQPGNTYQNPDKITGTPYNDGKSRYISSQAWVFYKLKSSGVPELNTGYVLRFIYDVRYNDSQHDPNTIGYWPDPHRKVYDTGVGLFTPEHGHDWVANNGAKNNYEGDYGRSSDEFVERYMHGGTIKWNGSQNIISDFVLPVDKEGNPINITNAQSLQGHIAIIDGEVSLCYKEMGDKPDHKVGILSPHYLVDRRLSRTKAVEERLYPLVKIGYNQFWMSRVLRTTTQIDGTPIKNYNLANGTPGVSLPTSISDIGPGYVYASLTGLDSSGTEGEKRDVYDPYNQYNVQERENYMIPPMYNLLTFSGSGMLPVSSYSHAEYSLPTPTDINILMKYLGWNLGKKLMTRGGRTREETNIFKETAFSALLNGKFFTQNANSHGANICGFDLRPEGYLGQNGFVGIGEYSAFLLMRDDDESNPQINGYLFNFPYYLQFTNPDPDSLYGREDIMIRLRDEPSAKYFAPVRFFMHFDVQDDNGGNAVQSVLRSMQSLSNKAPSEDAFECRDVYIGLDAVE